MPASPAANVDAAALRSRYVDVQPLADGAEGGSFLAREPGGAKVVCKPVPAGSLPAVRFAFDLLRAAASPHLPAPRELWTGPSGHPWMITDWIEGASLTPARLPADVALAEVLAVARALAVIHRAGTHHGDVSLANVVVTPTRGCVLVDLAQLGRLGSGTPGFLAPEVLAGGGGAPADRFALGSLACARLFGEVPWRRPEALVGLTAAQVRARLAALGADELPRALVELLAGLLDPDPTRRPADAAALVHRLEQLQWLARADRPALPVAAWHLPTRAPYRGVDPGPAVARVLAASSGADPLRLVVVTGPEHSGRRRVVEEIVQGVQLASTRDARLAEPVHADETGAWLERWLAAPGDAVIGWRVPLDERALPRQAAAAVAATSLTRAVLVVAAPPAWADALESLASTAVLVVRTRPWRTDELDAALAEVYEGESAAVREAVLAHTGGWSGRVVRSFAACAAAREPLFDRAAIERVLVAAPDLDTMTPALAREVLRVHWRVATDAERSALPLHLREGEVPLGSAIAAARAALGEAAVEQLARAELSSQVVASLSLALDADAVEVVQPLLQRGPPKPGSADASALVRWVQRRGAALPPAVLAVTARVLLAEGASASALALVDARREPELALEAARALQRLGRAEDALARLPRAPVGTRGDLALQIEGLALRLLVDLGRADEAVQAIDEGALAGRGIGCATLGLWAGYARLAIDDREAAARTLDVVDRAVAGLDDPRAAGLRARARQLQGNLALARGELAAAAAAWAAAAVAFEEGSEPVGELALRGSLCGLCVQSFAADGLAHGRVALRGLLARGDLDALATAAVNLAQLLARCGAREELAVLCQGLATALGAWAPPAAHARRDRAHAELAWCEAVAHGDRDTWQQARGAFDLAARRLARCELHAEASESWARASACARAAARLDVAASDLASARLEARRAGDDDPWRIVVEDCALAAVRGGAERSAAGLASIGIDQLEAWSARGQLDRAWAVARSGWAATRVVLPPGHPQRERMARRVLQIQESIMDKTAAADRAAVRTSLWAESEREALRDLVDATAPDEPRAAAAPAPSHAPASPRPDDHLERLLRIHRRLAREDRLEPLLEQVIDAVMELTDAERGAIVVLASDGTRRELTRELGSAGQAVQFSRSVIDRVIEGGEPVLSVDAAADDRFDGSRSISHLNLRSVLAVPLSFRGERLGAIYVDHRLRRGNFVEHDLERVEEFAELAAFAIAHARALAAVREQAARLAEQHERLASLLEAREVEVVGLRARVAEAETGGERHGLVGSAAPMQRVYRLVDRLADTDVPVVIYGESGTGKELVARAIHRAGARRDKPFVAENCGAIPETLLESVLFGHAKGAFTGADRAKPGLFEAAHGGTIFLDEVGETSAAMQTKLLRVLQEGEVRRVGENASRPVDVRVIAASNRDLEAMVEQGSFRRDLYYRIHVVRVELPPLRARTEDIGALVRHFLARRGGERLSVLPATLRALSGYAWPGNVRELENEVQRWIALCDDQVAPEDLSPALRGGEPAPDPDDLRIRPRVERLEHDLIARALERARGNQTKAAELLGLSRFGLQKKLRKRSDQDAEDTAEP